jgi:GNAT superfamily N-acetyltransferase
MAVDHHAGDRRPLRVDEFEQAAETLTEVPESVIAVHALRSGSGRAWVAGDLDDYRALLVESVLNPGEPQGFGDAANIASLLAIVADWGCVEVTPDIADELAGILEAKYGSLRRVVDLFHVLTDELLVYRHPLVRLLDAADAPLYPERFPPEAPMSMADVTTARVAAAIDNVRIVGQAASIANGRAYADIGVHVLADYRGQGIATAAASLVAANIRSANLVPVWSTSTDNHASRRVAAKLGFVAVSELVYLVPNTPA